MVYAGYDSLTGRRNYLTEVVSAGPKAATEAARVSTRLLNDVDERRNPTTRATLNQLLDRYLDVIDVEPNTRVRYEWLGANYMGRRSGTLPLVKLDGDLLDRFYAQLRQCRERCGGKVKHVKHRARRVHDCDDQCQPTPCKPLSASSIRATHWILSGALTRAVRWRWLNRNPIDSAEPPPPVRSNPSPPSPPMPHAC
jgi:integrase